MQADKAVAVADAERLAAALHAAQHRLRHMATAERRRDRELTRCHQAVAVVSATKVLTVDASGLSRTLNYITRQSEW